MIKKVNYKNIINLINSERVSKLMFDEEYVSDCSVSYTRHHWDGGYESWNGYNGTREEYYSDQREMFDFLRDFAREINATQCIIAPLHKYERHFRETNKSFRENDIFIAIYRILKEYDIRIDSKSGIILDFEKDFEVVKPFVEGGFRFVSNEVLYFPEKKVAIEPYHHMNYLIYAEDVKKTSEDLKLIGSSYDNIIVN